MTRSDPTGAAVTAFDGDHRWLSNFHPSPIVVLSTTWPTVEHAFQGLKTFDVAERRNVRDAPTALDAKTLGRKVTLRPDWEQVKDDVMLLCVRAKFTQHADLARLLLATGEAHLEEGNRHGDTVWGTVDGVGQNRLGRAVMQVRTELAQLAR